MHNVSSHNYDAMIFSDLNELDTHIENLQALQRHREEHLEITGPVIYVIFPTELKDLGARRKITERLHGAFSFKEVL